MQKKDKVFGLTSLDWAAIVGVVFAFACPPVCTPVAFILILAAILKHLNDIKDKTH